MASLRDPKIVYENDNGVVWIKESVTSTFLEMPSTSNFRKPMTNDPLSSGDLNEPIVIDSSDSDDLDPLNVSVNQKPNGESSLNEEDSCTANPLKHFTRHYYEKNEMIQMKTKTFICIYCGFTVFARKEVKEHIFKLHNHNLSVEGSTKSLYKFISSHVWESLPYRKRKKTIQYLKITKVFFCSHCTYKTVVPSCLRVHIEDMHNKKVLHCDKCLFTTSELTNLKTHLMLHLPQAYSCFFCPYQSLSNYHLSRHMNTAHNEQKDFNCMLCDFKTIGFIYLKRHINKHHSLRKPSNCPHCEYSSTDTTNLKRHIINRHGTKPNACPKCEFRAMSKKEIALHVVKRHKDYLLEKSIKIEDKHT